MVRAMSDSDRSSDVKGSGQPISQEAKKTAQQAADAAGVPLGAWLSRVIKNVSATELGRAGPPAGMPGQQAPAAEQRGAGVSPETAQWIWHVPVASLRTSRITSQRATKAKNIQALTHSIREKGMLQPIVVRPDPGAPGSYEIVAGERRWRAATRAQLAEVPVVIINLSDREALELALVENLQREGLTPLEEAEGYRRLAEDFGVRQGPLAKAVGKSRSHVSNTLRLLKLAKPVKDLVAKGKLTAGHARALLTVDNPARIALVVVEEGLTVRQTEELAQILRMVAEERRKLPRSKKPARIKKRMVAEERRKLPRSKKPAGTKKRMVAEERRKPPRAKKPARTKKAAARAAPRATKRPRRPRP